MTFSSSTEFKTIFVSNKVFFRKFTYVPIDFKLSFTFQLCLVLHSGGGIGVLRAVGIFQACFGLSHTQNRSILTHLPLTLRTSDNKGFKLVSRRALKAAFGQNLGKSKFFTQLILIEIIFSFVFLRQMNCRRK